MDNPLLWLENIERGELNLVGGKALNLATILNSGIRTAPGFCITTEAFKSAVPPALYERLKQSSVFEDQRLKNDTIIIPKDLEEKIIAAYHLLVRSGVDANPAVAVRSSATVEDSATSSFAGQLKSFLGVRGDEQLLEAVKNCWTSAFTPRAQAYIKNRNVLPESILISVLIQLMVDSEVSGIAFTINPIDGDFSKIVIEAAWGLGETVVSGTITPDTYFLDKETLEIFYKNIAEKPFMLVMNNQASGTVRLELPRQKQSKECLGLAQLQALAEISKDLEKLFSHPQDIEWAISKVDGEIYILQSRPITTI
jgi:pyruvate,water dikinase